MNGTTIVFVEGTRLELPVASTALDAVRARSAAAATEVEEGKRVITDSRGLPVASDTPIHGGAIFRVVANRAAGAGDADDPAESGIEP